MADSNRFLDSAGVSLVWNRTKERINTEVAAYGEKVDASYDKIKYNISDTPVGTIVDYNDREIRVMIPKDADFHKQTVGEGGDANSYYITFKTYAPNNNVVGYKEYINGQSDKEILTDLKTDEYNRKYQPTWFPAASYDTANNTWKYYGASSSAEKYIGWDYRIDWYDENNIVIASDSIRINLSNEECHYEIEPSYVNGAIREVKTYVDGELVKIQALTNEELDAILV